MTVANDPRAILSSPDLIAVGAQGDDVRRAMHGTRTTFVRVFEIHVDAIPASAPQGLAAGEVRLVGRPGDERAAVAAVAASAAIAGGVPLTGFSLADLRRLSPHTKALQALCGTLRAAGLVAIADVPLDSSPVAELAEAVLAARAGGLAAERLTVHAQPPDAQRIDAQIDMVERAQRLQDRAGGFRAFAPLPRSVSITQPTTGYADLKLIAVARIVASNIDSIQVDWPLYGPKLAQVALTVGADDIDGVLAVEPGVLGTRRSAIEEIKNNIRAAALDAVERNGRFEQLS
jgi:aminodeoxyfutalosine synthase